MKLINYQKQYEVTMREAVRPYAAQIKSSIKRWHELRKIESDYGMEAAEEKYSSVHAACVASECAPEDLNNFIHWGAFDIRNVKRAYSAIAGLYSAVRENLEKESRPIYVQAAQAVLPALEGIAKEAQIQFDRVTEELGQPEGQCNFCATVIAEMRLSLQRIIDGHELKDPSDLLQFCD